MTSILLLKNSRNKKPWFKVKQSDLGLCYLQKKTILSIFYGFKQKLVITNNGSLFFLACMKAERSVVTLMPAFAGAWALASHLKVYDKGYYVMGMLSCMSCITDSCPFLMQFIILLLDISVDEHMSLIKGDKVTWKNQVNSFRCFFLTG